jgi:hypothetical protein
VTHEAGFLRVQRSGLTILAKVFCMSVRSHNILNPISQGSDASWSFKRVMESFDIL